MNQSVRPDFSIIICTLNAASTFQNCLDSIDEQSWQSKETIVIDGESEDGTVEILKRNSPRIAYWVSETDNGIYDAWNKAISLAKGQWILFLGADDVLACPSVLEITKKAIDEKWNGENIAYAHVDLIDERGRVYENFGKNWALSKKSIGYEMSIGHQAMFHRREAFERYGHFDETFRISADYDFLLRVVRCEAPLYLGPITVARKMRGGVSMVISKGWATTKETRQAQINNNFFTAKAKTRFYLNSIKGFIYFVFGRKITERLVDFYRILILRRPPKFR